MTTQNHAYIKDSVVNNIALENLRFLRQRASDRAWDKQAEELAKKRAQDNRKGRAARLQGISTLKVTKKQILQAKDELIMEYMSVSDISNGWTSNDGKTIPEFPDSLKNFADSAGIDIGHLRELEQGTVSFTLDDAVKIARVGNIDLATFLTPSMENLENDLFIDVTPISLKHGPMRMYEWLLWIRGLRALPGQDADEFELLAVLPKPQVGASVDSRRTRDPEVRKREDEKAWSSPISVKKLLDNDKFKKDLDDLSNPYAANISKLSFNLVVHQKIVRRILILSFTLKKLFRTPDGSGEKGKHRTSWSNSLSRVRYMISGIVVTLLRLGKKT